MTKNDDNDVGLTIDGNWGKLGMLVKSRYIAALDRVRGRRVEAGSLDVERRVASHNAMTEARLLLISTAAKTLAKELENDPDLAGRALQTFSRFERESENSEACLDLTLQDLQNRPGAIADQTVTELNPEIVDRWHRYASGATSEQLRERWGRILASEIRAPGTFSFKCMRILDELEPSTAEAFERLCANRIDYSVPSCLAATNASDLQALAEAELIVATDLERCVDFLPTVIGSGSEVLLLDIGDYAIALHGSIRRARGFPESLFVGLQGTGLGLPIITLTEAGKSISSILPDPGLLPAHNLIEAIRQNHETDAVSLLRRDGQTWQPIELGAQTS